MNFAAHHVCAVLPAHDEQATIAAAIEALQSQGVRRIRTRVRRLALKAGGHFWHIACPCGWWGSTPTGPEMADLATTHRAACPLKKEKP